ncbi:MAG: T9SS type A sorting domain-containing protein [Flavobacteriales bacterium]|nr:T9SS type A sorting domain-containing protein [Flavobacteriales bacterium]
MKKLGKIGLLALAACISGSALAKENVGELSPTKTGQDGSTQSKNKFMKYASDCEPASAQADLDVNNVRTRILNGGDMWWDLNNARYEIPKLKDLNAVRKNSLFAGAIWIGGEDQGVLKLAAMTYRQGGSDYFPGPLDPVLGTTNKDRCDAYDNIYKVNREDIEKHREAWEKGTLISVPESIKNWPGNGRGAGEPDQLAPFFDQDSNGIYDPFQGDYPVLQTECRGVPIARDKNKPTDQPDQMLWFVYNDRGNIHSETQAQSQGLELQTTAFAFATNDEVNNMTFYTTRIINRGSNLENTYFGQWVDPDLGNYSDDFVGCDVGLSLGFCYNGDDNDEGILGYGLNPPSIGVDFFEGPKRDTTINGKDTLLELGMSKFVFYDNDFTFHGNPEQPVHYYNYLKGRWKNGDCMKRGGNGYSGSVCTDYMFPGTTDPKFTDDWTEKLAGNTKGDRRFLQTSGPFILKKGAVNKITVGVVWAKANSGGATGSLNILKAASRKAQELFDNCFDILDGPDAPTIEAQELDEEVVIMFNDTKRIEDYKEVTISDGKPVIYHFQGYRVYQLADATAGTGDLTNIDKARQVFVCDIKDSITRLINKPFDEDLGEPAAKLMVEGPNKGLVHSLSITEDAFATNGNSKLVNHKTYYFMIISYAALPGHRDQEYLAGRKIAQFSVTPHQTEIEGGGTLAHGGYGDGPQLRRLEGRGNGGLDLQLTEETINEILLYGKSDNPLYEIGKGPVNIKIVDPLKVPQGEFELVLLENPAKVNALTKLQGLIADQTNWILINKTSGDTIFSQYTIDYENEQLITARSTENELLDWGMSVTLKQVVGPGHGDVDETNGFLSWNVAWEDNSKQWLTAIPDIDGASYYNWIRSGRVGNNASPKDYSEHDFFATSGNGLDEFELYENIWDGRIAPYRLTAYSLLSNVSPQPKYPYSVTQGVAFQGSRNPNIFQNLDNVSSIDLVFTPDESKWTQCLVLELGEESALNQGGAKKFEIRKHNSINIDGTENAAEQGRTWFPGYAINVETGQRLNIILGEDSYQGLNNGRDLKWNPTDQSSPYSLGSYPYAAFGGRHYIYIMDADTFATSTTPISPNVSGGVSYDKCGTYLSILNGTGSYETNLNSKVLSHAMWVMPAFMARGYEMEYNGNGMPVPPTEVKFQIRVSKPYRYYATNENQNKYNPRYSFNTNSVYTEKSANVGKNALETVKLVPNPYMANSAYENNPVENKVKIINLPPQCKISIYTLDGSLVRRIVKDDNSTEYTWDLKNSAKVPIASGTYIIHIDGGDLGEKVVKWMGIIRELDLDSF